MGFLECVSKHPNKIFKIWLPGQSHYDSETRIEILCKKAVPNPRYGPISFIWTRFIEEFLELKSLGQNVNLTFQNDADDGDGDGDVPTTHPSWQVPREQHAQGANILFGNPSL